MISPPNDRFELVLMADQPAPIRLWAEAPAASARRFEYGKEKSVRILGVAACMLLMLLLFFPAATILLALALVIVVFPMKLVGMAGFSRG